MLRTILLLCSLSAAAALRLHGLATAPHAHGLVRRDVLLSALRTASAALLIAATPALAKYGTYANYDGQTSSMAAGDANNKCLFAQPGSGICMVYESSQPKLYASPDQKAALGKLLAAADRLGEAQLVSSQWHVPGGVSLLTAPVIGCPVLKWIRVRC